MVLVDTSVWIEVFRRLPSVRLDSEVELDDVVTVLPIIQEVLQGFRDEAAFRVAREAMFALPIVESPLPSERFLEGAQLYRAAWRAGRTVRSSIDCLIAACALRHGLVVLHLDRDYDEIARVSALQSRRVKTRSARS